MMIYDTIIYLHLGPAFQHMDVKPGGVINPASLKYPAKQSRVEQPCPYRML